VTTRITMLEFNCINFE